MSDAEIEIQNAVEHLAKQGLEVTVDSVQKYLAANSEFFKAKGITQVPVEWIIPAIEAIGGPWKQYHGYQSQQTAYWYFTCSLTMHKRPIYGQVLQQINDKLPSVSRHEANEVIEARGQYQSGRHWSEKWPTVLDSITGGLFFTLDETNHIGKGVYTEVSDVLKKGLPVYLVTHSGTFYAISSLVGDAFMDGPDWTYYTFVDVARLANPI